MTCGLCGDRAATQFTELDGRTYAACGPCLEPAVSRAPAAGRCLAELGGGYCNAPCRAGHFCLRHEWIPRRP